MATHFGWSDTFYAVTGCFSCHAASSSTDSLNNYAHNASNRRRRRRHPPHSVVPLPEGLGPFLLTDSTDDDDGVDALSLHSNVGGSSSARKNRSRRLSGFGSVTSFETDGDEEEAAVSTQTQPHNNLRSKNQGKKKKKARDRSEGWFTFLGYSLFGKAERGIQLPLTDDDDDDDDDDDELIIQAQRRASRKNRRSGSAGAEGIRRTQSGATLDSDAAPLDDAEIAARVSQPPVSSYEAPVGVADGATTKQGAELAALRERLKKAEKEEKRRKRRERKERGALERALSAGSSLSVGAGSAVFEGFQGSGDGASLVALKSPPSESLVEGGGGDDEDADFDGAVYVRPNAAAVPAGSASEPRTARSSSSASTFDRRSHPRPNRRTTSQRSHFHSNNSDANVNDADQFPGNKPGVSFQPQFPVDPLGGGAQQEDRMKKKRSTRRPVPLASSSTATSSQSPSLPSPTGSTSLGSGLSASLSFLASQAAQFKAHETAAAEQPAVTGFSENVFFTAPYEEDEYILDGTTAPLGLELDNHDGNHGFPSVGFGRVGLNGKGKQLSNGAFLARRGD